MSSTVLPIPDRPSLNGAWPARPYIGPKAQAAVHEAFYDRIAIEATDRQAPLTTIWREVIYAGMKATGRATLAEVREACRLAGIDPAALNGAA